MKFRHFISGRNSEKPFCLGCDAIKLLNSTGEAALCCHWQELVIGISTQWRLHGRCLFGTYIVPRHIPVWNYTCTLVCTPSLFAFRHSFLRLLAKVHTIHNSQ